VYMVSLWVANVDCERKLRFKYLSSSRYRPGQVNASSDPLITPAYHSDTCRLIITVNKCLPIISLYTNAGSALTKFEHMEKELSSNGLTESFDDMLWKMGPIRLKKCVV